MATRKAVKFRPSLAPARGCEAIENRLPSTIVKRTIFIRNYFRYFDYVSALRQSFLWLGFSQPKLIFGGKDLIAANGAEAQ
jgi:hypothetical protein